MTGVSIEEIPPVRRIEPAPERVAIVGRARRGPQHQPVEVASLAAYDARFGGRDMPLRRAVAAYLDQDADLPLVVRSDDLASALAGLAGSGVTLLVVAPSLLRGHEELAHDWCEQHRGLLLLDCPDGSLPSGLGANAAGYTPRLRDAATRRVWTAAAVAGVVRRLDARRGVWKAPAGTEAELHGVRPDPPPAGVTANLVREVPGRPPLVWGAHTASDDPEWRYVNVRRLALFLERSLDAGLRWTVFEPSDERLWGTVRSLIDDFLSGLWRAGAFPGSTPDEAYFVRCDRTTMTQNDLDNGRLVCFVGIAPVRPAEFVILRFEQATLREG